MAPAGDGEGGPADLLMVLMMLSSSSLEAGLWPPMGNTRLMGSNKRDRDLDR